MREEEKSPVSSTVSVLPLLVAAALVGAGTTAATSWLLQRRGQREGKGWGGKTPIRSQHPCDNHSKEYELEIFEYTASRVRRLIEGLGASAVSERTEEKKGGQPRCRLAQPSSRDLCLALAAVGSSDNGDNDASRQRRRRKGKDRQGDQEEEEKKEEGLETCRFPREPEDPLVVLDTIATAGERASTESRGARYVDYVNGGTLPVALGADILTSTLDQNAWHAQSSPLAARFEHVVIRWLAEILHLGGYDSPPEGMASSSQASPCRRRMEDHVSLPCAALVSGAATANLTALAVAREHLCPKFAMKHRRTFTKSNDTDQTNKDGDITVYVSAECHGSVYKALRVVGLLSPNLITLPTDQTTGAVTAVSLATLKGVTCQQPALIILQAGHVLTGACDDVAAVQEWAHQKGKTTRRGKREQDPDDGQEDDAQVWIHVDGAFGLWSAVQRGSATRTRAVEAARLADSWATDLHKVLNVPYDSALVAVHSSHTAAYRRAFSLSASTAGDEDPSTASLYGGKATSSYHMKENGEGEGETPCWDSTLESLTTVEPCLQNSSRARGISAYAALRTLGQEGLCELVERMARCAAVFAAKATAEDLPHHPKRFTLEGTNGTVPLFNQVLLSLHHRPTSFSPEEEAVILQTTAARVREDARHGVWLRCCGWRGRTVVRCSFCCWRMGEKDAEIVAIALREALDEVLGSWSR